MQPGPPVAGAFPDIHRELLDVPTADLWYRREGKIDTFNCYNVANVWLAQLGAAPDVESAIEAAAGAQAYRADLGTTRATRSSTPPATVEARRS